MRHLRAVPRDELARKTWIGMSRTQRIRFVKIAWAHQVYGDACGTGIQGANATATLRVLRELSVVENFLGSGGFVRLRPTDFGYDVLEQAEKLGVAWKPQASAMEGS